MPRAAKPSSTARKIALRSSPHLPVEKASRRDLFEQARHSLVKAAELADRSEARRTQPLQRFGDQGVQDRSGYAVSRASQESSNCANVPTRVGRTGKPDRANSCRRCSAIVAVGVTK